MLRPWIIKVLGSIIGSWFFFVGVTIESIGNTTYDYILIVWTLLAIVSLVLLKLYSNVLD